MNWYFYWYFTIYNIYKHFSRDKQFAIFATGMFSVVIFFWLYGISNISLFYLGEIDVLYSKKYTIAIIGFVVLLLNYSFLLPKKIRLYRYDKYLTVRSDLKDWVFLLLSVLSIVLLIISISLARSYFIGSN